MSLGDEYQIHKMTQLAIVPVTFDAQAELGGTI
jgi:hypothetical protein